jgi:hypothetical protein
VFFSATALSLYKEVTFFLAHQNLSTPEITAESAINCNINTSNHLKGEINDCRDRLEDLEDNQTNLEIFVQRLISEVISLRVKIKRLQFIVDRQGGNNSGKSVSIYNPDKQFF